MTTRPLCCAPAALVLAAGIALLPARCVSQPAGGGYSATVAADGTGQFTSVEDAINAAPQTTGPDSPWIIRVRAGTYRERVYVQRERRFVRLVGENPSATTIAFGLYAAMPGADGRPMGTFHTPTVWIDADDFAVENLTIANTAGKRGQALALRVDGDRVAFRNCTFLGWQDTILVNRGRQYFAGCRIAGAVDFIFGGATAYFDACEIRCLGDGYITAASTPAAQDYGLVFSGCRILGDPPSARAYLGRPWRPYASVSFVGTRMTEVIRPAGWHNWNKPESEKTARFAEFASSGSGAIAAARVPWARTSGAAEPGRFTAARVLGGPDNWDPAHVSEPDPARPR